MKLTINLNLNAPWLSSQLGELREVLQRLVERSGVMSVQLERLITAVTDIRGKVDSLIALVAGLADLIRQLRDDPAALDQLATDLQAKAADIQAALDANPL